MLSKIQILATAASVLALAGGANAAQFAAYSPVPGSVANISLVGTTLSANAPISFEYDVPGSLAALGDLQAHLSLSATETGATSFGPLALATFDGSFSITFAGATGTYHGIHLTNGETLLDGEFLDSVFTGYGTTATLQDSILGGGLVNYNDNSLIAFQPPGGDEGLTLGVVNIDTVVQVHNGMVSAFSGVSNGIFAADNVVTTGGGVPEPATWALMLVGVSAVGGVVRRRKAALAWSVGRSA